MYAIQAETAAKTMRGEAYSGVALELCVRNLVQLLHPGIAQPTLDTGVAQVVDFHNTARQRQENALVVRIGTVDVQVTYAY